MSPTVSVIMPLYNSAGFMVSGIASVLSQSFTDLEIILINDCSNDDSLERAYRLSNRDGRIRVLSLQENSGAAIARNTGIDAAKGRFLAFLDSDDVWQPKKLEIQLNSMREQNAVFSYTDFSVVTMDGAVKRTVLAPNRVGYFDLLKDTTIGCSTVIYDRGKLGLRRFPLIRKRQDLALWLSILRDVDFAHRCGPALTHYRERVGSISHNKFDAAMYTWKVYRDLEGISLVKSSYYFSRYAISSIIRRL